MVYSPATKISYGQSSHLQRLQTHCVQSTAASALGSTAHPSRASAVPDGCPEPYALPFLDFLISSSMLAFSFLLNFTGHACKPCSVIFEKCYPCAITKWTSHSLVIFQNSLCLLWASFSLPHLPIFLFSVLLISWSADSGFSLGFRKCILCLAAFLRSLFTTMGFL